MTSITLMFIQLIQYHTEPIYTKMHYQLLYIIDPGEILNYLTMTYY